MVLAAPKKVGIMQKLWLVIFVIGFMQLAQDVWAQDTPENPDTNQHCKAVLVSGLSPSNPFYADMYRPAYAELRPLRYDQLQVHHLEEAIRFTKHQLDHVQQEVINLVDAPTFANTVEPVLSALAWHGRSKSVLHMMHILNSSKEIDELAEKLSPLLASDLLRAFYLRVSQIKNVPELTETQQYIVADILSNPEAQKIKMSSEQIAKILEIDEQLRTKERTFRKNFESTKR